MGRFLLIVACLSVFQLSQVQAQNSANSHHHDPPTIDGASHPELIPDPIAYRLYLSTISLGPNPTDEDRKRQRAQISQIGLQDDDCEALKGVLVEFRAKFDDYVQRYNQTAEAAAARNEKADLNAFFRQLDGLVKSTRETLKLQLTPAGLTQFEAFVQAEKRKMKVQLEDEQ